MPTIIQLQDNRDIKNNDYLLIEQDKSRKVTIDTLVSYIKKINTIKDLDDNIDLNNNDYLLVSQDKDRKITLNELAKKVNESLDITTFENNTPLYNSNYVLVSQSGATNKVPLDVLSVKINSNMNLNRLDNATALNNTDLIMLGQDKTRKVTLNDLSNKINSSLNINEFNNNSSLNNTDTLLIGQFNSTKKVTLNDLSNKINNSLNINGFNNNSSLNNTDTLLIGQSNSTNKVSLNDLSNKINSNINLTKFESTTILNNSDYLMLGRQDKIRRITMETLYTSIRSALNINDLENRINGVITTVAEGKELISTAINNKGGNANVSDTFYTLSQKINGLNINGFVEKNNKFYEIVVEGNNVKLYEFYPVISASVEGDDTVSISITNTFYKEAHNIKLCNSKGVTISQTTKESIKGNINTNLILNKAMYDDSYIIKVIVNNKTFSTTIKHHVELREVWVYKANVPFYRSEFAAQTFSDGSFITIAGAIGTPITSCYVYNQSSDSWSMVNSSPYSLKGLMSVINNNDEIFTIGGIDNDGISRGYTSCYSKRNDKWTTKSSTLPISEGVSEISNNIIYVLGGKRSSGLNDYVLMYNTITDTWSYGIRYDMRIYNACSVLYNNNIYIFGGLNKTDNAQSSVYVYNINTSTMSSLSNMPYIISQAGSCIIDGFVYITGGYYYTRRGYVTNKVSCYDIKNNNWKECTPLNEARNLHGCVASNGEVYVISGRNNDGNLTKSVECFTRRK